MTDDERPLSDGWPSVGGTVLSGGAVHRFAGPWTPAVHALLRHLDAAGFDGAPRVLGFDGLGREVLTWVEGDAPCQPWPSWMRSEEALVGVATLLRRYHDAVAAFVAPPDASWRVWLGSPGGPIIRHGDLWPSNVVFRSGGPVALIDWDFAQPGTPLDDICSAAKHWIPLCSDERAGRDGWDEPVDRVTRLRVLCDAYGLDHEQRRALIPTALRNARYGYDSHKAWGEAGEAGFAQMWRDGSGALILEDMAWLDDARDDLSRFAGGG
ncbi:MAG: phosphotransferase [Acidimicrobiales bacterium]